MEPSIAILGTAAVVGLVLGSFAGALSYRLPRGLSVADGRSRCPACGAVLGVRDLVPVLSWLFLQGRCRHCRAAVSPRYPLIEATTALAFVFAAAILDDPATLVLTCLVAVILVVLAAIDLEHGLLPNALIIALLPLALALRWLADGTPLWGLAGAFLGAGGAFALRAVFLWLTGRDGLGMGDVKFMFAAGMILQPLDWPAFLILSGLIGIATGLFWKRGGKGAAFPFGPALIAALYLCMLFPGLGRWMAGV